MGLKQITDIDLIIFLVIKGFEIKQTQKDGNRSIVYFEDSNNLDSAVLKFANRTENINIADYQAAQKRVKTLLYTKNIK